MENSELIITIAGMIAVAIVTGVVVWLTTRNVTGAFVAAIDRIMADTAGMDAVEDIYLDNVPAEIQAIVIAVLGAVERLADGSATEADDKLIDLLKALTDGQPNAAVG